LVAIEEEAMTKTLSRRITAIVSFAAVCLVSAIPLAAAQDSAGASSDARESSSLQQQIVAAEREGLDALKAGNIDRFAQLTADDVVFVDAAGPANKTKVVSNVAGFHLTDYSMDDVQFVQIAENSGLIVYKITEKGISHGREFAAQAYIASLWTKRNGKWVCQFSQETAVRPPKE
jgi:ketosteroid isomerase-like protein